MAYVTRYGTRVLNEKAARMAIIEECYHRDESAEYAVYGYQALKHGMEPGDSILIRNSEAEGMAWTTNLVHGESKLVSWDDIAHCVAPKLRPVS